MNINELIIELNRIKKDNGNVEVMVDDADTGWLFKITSDDLTVIHDWRGGRLEIGPDYSSDRMDDY